MPLHCSHCSMKSNKPHLTLEVHLPPARGLLYMQMSVAVTLRNSTVPLD